MREYKQYWSGSRTVIVYQVCNPNVLLKVHYVFSYNSKIEGNIMYMYLNNQNSSHHIEIEMWFYTYSWYHLYMY